MAKANPISTGLIFDASSEFGVDKEVFGWLDSLLQTVQVLAKEPTQNHRLIRDIVAIGRFFASDRFEIASACEKKFDAVARGVGHD